MPTQETHTDAVLRLQRYLRQLSYDHEEIFPPPIDGIFERDTLRSLNDFQRLKGLPITESADRETWDLLYASYLASLAENRAPLSVVIFPRVPETTELQLGAVGFPVSAVQYMLTELSPGYPSLAFPTVTGIYNEETEAAVREFQRRNNLPANGRVDQKTWDSIVSQYNSIAERYSKE